MDKHEETILEVGRVVTKVTGVPSAAIAVDANLLEQGLLDSLQALEVVALLEQRFNFVMPIDDVAEIASIVDLATTIERLCRAASTTQESSVHA